MARAGRRTVRSGSSDWRPSVVTGVAVGRPRHNRGRRRGTVGRPCHNKDSPGTTPGLFYALVQNRGWQSLVESSNRCRLQTGVRSCKIPASFCPQLPPSPRACSPAARLRQGPTKSPAFVELHPRPPVGHLRATNPADRAHAGANRQKGRRRSGTAHRDASQHQADHARRRRDGAR